MFLGRGRSFERGWLNITCYSVLSVLLVHDSSRSGCALGSLHVMYVGLQEDSYIGCQFRVHPISSREPDPSGWVSLRSHIGSNSPPC